MKKLYSIEYDHVSGKKSKQTTSILTLSIWLDDAISDEYVLQSSIVIETEEREV